MHLSVVQTDRETLARRVEAQANDVGVEIERVFFSTLGWYYPHLAIVRDGNITAIVRHIFNDAFCAHCLIGAGVHE